MFKRLLILLLLPATAFSSGYLTPLGTGVDVSRIHAHENGGFTMWVDPSSIANPDSCARTDKVHVKPTTPGYDTLLSVALSAYVSGNKIGMWSHHGCAIIPFWGGPNSFPIVSDLWMVKD